MKFWRMTKYICIQNCPFEMFKRHQIYEITEPYTTNVSKSKVVDIWFNGNLLYKSLLFDSVMGGVSLLGTNCIFISVAEHREKRIDEILND